MKNLKANLVLRSNSFILDGVLIPCGTEFKLMEHSTAINRTVLKYGGKIYSFRWDEMCAYFNADKLPSDHYR